MCKRELLAKGHPFPEGELCLSCCDKETLQAFFRTTRCIYELFPDCRLPEWQPDDDEETVAKYADCAHCGEKHLTTEDMWSHPDYDTSSVRVDDKDITRSFFVPLSGEKLGVLLQLSDLPKYAALASFLKHLVPFVRGWRDARRLLDEAQALVRGEAKRVLESFVGPVDEAQCSKILGGPQLKRVALGECGEMTDAHDVVAFVAWLRNDEPQ